MTSDSSQQICKIDISNLIELFFYFENTQKEGEYQFNLFQPDILMKSVVFDKGSRYKTLKKDCSLEQNPENLKNFISSVIKGNLINTQKIKVQLDKLHLRDVEIYSQSDMLMLGFGMF